MIRNWLHNVKIKIGLVRNNGNEHSAESLEESDIESPMDSSLLIELPEVLDTLNESVQQFNNVAQDQKKSIIQQSSALHQLASTSEEFVATSRSISDSAGSVEQSALQNISSCKKGKETLENATKNMGMLSRQVKSFVADIGALGAQNREISGIVEIISEITTQLDLLSLNAQIEAAGAGSFGKRFSVVADEVKHLADTSKDATRHIQNIINAILDGMTQLVGSAQKSLEATLRTMEQMNEVTKDIQCIHDEVIRTHSMAQEIKVSTHQQSAAQDQLAQSVAEIDALGTKNAETITEQVEKAITQLSDMAQYLSLILEETVLKELERNENLSASSEAFHGPH